MVVNQGPRFAAAGLFTSNRVRAAPVSWSRAAVTDGRLRAVVLNSGGANACTGAGGQADTAQTAAAAARLLGCEDRDVAVCSTGMIGVRLPMPRLLAGLTRAAAELATDGGPAAATAIMTTDTHSKQVSVTSPAGYTVAGMAKGAGMLAPALATMLAVITTDAEVGSAQLAASLRIAGSLTFDRIDSDGCQSTNDTVLALASGASGVTPAAEEFTAVLARVCWQLTRLLIEDAEGAAHDIEIEVAGAATEADALTVARAVARRFSDARSPSG